MIRFCNRNASTSSARTKSDPLASRSGFHPEPITASTASTSSSVLRITSRKSLPIGMSSTSKNTLLSPYASTSRSRNRPATHGLSSRR